METQFVLLALIPLLGPLALRKTKWFVWYLALIGSSIGALWVMAALSNEDCRAGCALGLFMLVFITAVFCAGSLLRLLAYVELKYALLTLAGVVSALIMLFLYSIFYSGPETLVAFFLISISGVIALICCIAKTVLKLFAPKSQQT